MKKSVLFVSLLFSFFCHSQITVQKIWVEKLSNPLGLGVARPSFTWQSASEGRGVMQTAYEIKVSRDNAAVWNSGKVTSDQSVAVQYKGSTLQADKKYSCQ